MTSVDGTVQVNDVARTQLEHLDDTDLYASAWSEALQASKVQWGGRGQGGRGLNRRTWQRSDVVVDNVRLEYVGRSTAAVQARLLLEHATLKLLSGHVYALIGQNGCGKSTLLRRMHTGKIPGFPPHVSTLYVSQEDEIWNIHHHQQQQRSESSPPSTATNVRDWMYKQFRDFCNVNIRVAGKARIDELEQAMNELDLSTNDPEIMKRMEELSEALSLVEDEVAETQEVDGLIQKQAEQALSFMGIPNQQFSLPIQKLTSGQRKRVSLAAALMICMFTSCDLLLLDEPTNSLDIQGLILLRQMVGVVNSRGGGRQPTTVLLVSHDCDFINDVATDVIEFQKNLTLQYYAGNYADFLVQKQQLDRREHHMAAVMDKREDAMKQTLENLKKQVTSKKGGREKKAKQIASFKKKMERALGDNDYEGLPMTSSMPRRTAKWKRPEGEPDKAIQFNFRNCTSKWNEPLILAMEIGYKSDENQDQDHGEEQNEKQTAGSSIVFDENGVPIITKKHGFLFDCIDLCINEGEKYCILGENVSAETSILLKILAKIIQPTEGVVHTVNVDIAFLDSEKILSVLEDSGTPLSYLTEKFPQKPEHDIRAELTAFGLNPKQASTELRFLSGGERCRLCLAEIMLRNPHVICLDQPTANLDLESVDALIYGLKKWDGTVIMVSHDAYFLRSLDVKLYALIAEEGKLRRVEGGIEAYLRSFANPM